MISLFFSFPISKWQIIAISAVEGSSYLAGEMFELIDFYCLG
jgi:hypothetical protein